jgi:hypothetical protein
VSKVKLRLKVKAARHVFLPRAGLFFSIKQLCHWSKYPTLAIVNTSILQMTLLHGYLAFNEFDAITRKTLLTRIWPRDDPALKDTYIRHFRAPLLCKFETKKKRRLKAPNIRIL